MYTLYDLTTEMVGLMAMAQEEDLDPITLADTLESLEGDYSDKLEDYCKVIRIIETDISGLDAEIERMSTRKAQMQNNVKRMKDAMLASMNATGNQKIKGTLFNISVAKNGGKLPLLMPDPEAVPDEFKKTIIETKPDSDKIREALDSGRELGFAFYGERGVHLSIK